VAAQAVGNILLVIADDLGIDNSSFYPTTVRFDTVPPAPKAPNLLALAQKSVLFKRAWATPYCSPTRAAILTGRYGFRTGIGWPKQSGFPELALDETTLPEIFHRTKPDFMLAHIGKWHLSNGYNDPNIQGWDYYAGPEPGIGQLPSYFRWNKVINGILNPSTTYNTTDIVNEAVQFIVQAKSSNRPYFAWIAFHAPHTPFHKPPNSLITRTDLPPSGAPKRDYFEAMVEALDTEIGRLLRSVDFSTTNVIFLGDNGTTQGVVLPPYNPIRSKGTIYQNGVNVPLMVAGAGVSSPGRLIKAIVNTVDLFPTILELAGIDMASTLPPNLKTDGVSLLPYIRNYAHPKPRKWGYSEVFMMNYDGDYARIMRNFDFKLIKKFDGSREFYNVTVDPLELNNLLLRPLTASENANLYQLESRLTDLLSTR
jgi:arylsulfatase A-like enzyme